MKEKDREAPKTIFLEVAIQFLITALEDLKKNSVKKDSSFLGSWTQNTDLSERKRNIATKLVITLGNFQPHHSDQDNKRVLEQSLSDCRNTAKNLSSQSGKKDEGTFGPAMQKIELFLKQFYDTLLQCSGYCLLKVKTNPIKSYGHIEILTGIQKTIIYCENEDKFYYKDIINKMICYIETPVNPENNRYESMLLAHQKLTEAFQSIKSETYRKASPEELEHIFLITDKKACNFLDVVYHRNDAYSMYLYHMAYYFAQCTYEGTSTALIDKVVRHFVPEVDKVPQIIDKLEECNGDLNLLNKDESNYQAGKVKIVLGSIQQLESGNKELVQKASYEPKIKVDLKVFSSVTISSDKFNSSEGRLGVRLRIAKEEIKLSNRKILSEVQKIKISNQTPTTLLSTHHFNKNNTNALPSKIHHGIKVLPEYPKNKIINPQPINANSKTLPLSHKKGQVYNEEQDSEIEIENNIVLEHVKKPGILNQQVQNEQNEQQDTFGEDIQNQETHEYTQNENNTDYEYEGEDQYEGEPENNEYRMN